MKWRWVFKEFLKGELLGDERGLKDNSLQVSIEHSNSIDTSTRHMGRIDNKNVTRLENQSFYKGL